MNPPPAEFCNKAYDVGPNGRATNIRIEHNGAVDPQALALHTQAARTMESSGGVLDRIDSLVRQTGADKPAVGTAAWEARIEIDKINGEIGQIQTDLSRGNLTPYEQAAAQLRLQELDAALNEQAARIPQTDAEGQGWVASPARGSEQAAVQGWPEAPAGYHWMAQANGTPRLDRLPGNDSLPQQNYDPASGQFVPRTTTPRGGLTVADTADRNAAINDWMRGQGHDALTSDNAQAVIAQYRATARPPVTDSAGNQGTVAAIEVNGQTFVGLNSHNYAGGDGLALQRDWAQRLGIADLPFHRQVVYHAEADALIQAYTQNNEAMPSSVTLHTDNPPCAACQGNLGDLAREMGIRDLRIEVSDGSVWTLNAQGKLVEVK